MQLRRTRLSALAMTAAFSVFGVTAGCAQTPEAEASRLSALGLPELAITYAAGELVVPAEIRAGPTYVTFDNQSEDYGEAQFIALPPDVSVDALSEALQQETLPDWLYESTLAGGVFAPAGQQDSTILNLTPGTWWLINTESETTTAPASVTVTGDAVDPAAAGIEADLEVEMGPYVFNFPDEVAAGPQIWEVTNTHAVPHHIVLVSYPEPVTVEQVEATIMFEGTGTPVPGMLDFENMADAAYISILSEGQTSWNELDLEPGNYIALCFISDQGQMVPHAAMGMIDVFTVVAD